MNKRMFRGIALLLVIAAVLAGMVINLHALLAFGGTLLQILTPLFLGIALAFVLNLPTGATYRLYVRLFGKAKIRLPLIPMAIATVYLLFVALIGGLLAFIIPQLVDSIGLLSANIGTYSENVVSYLKQLAILLNLDALDIPTSIQAGIESLPSMLSSIAQGLFPQIFNITTGVVRSFTNLLIGFLLSVYLLADKDRLKDRLRKMLLVYVKEDASKEVLRVGGMVSRTFTSFVNGQLADMLILGTLCFVGMTIFGFRYAPLISVIIAVTNVIPIAGPVIGAIPSIFILLMSDPVQALWFALFLVVLQQIDGNLIYPRVVGDSIGLPPLLVLLAIIVGGGLFGILGMLLGVPAVSVLYRLLREETMLRWNRRPEATVPTEGNPSADMAGDPPAN